MGTSFCTTVMILMAFSFFPTKAEKVMRPKFKDVKLWSDQKFLSHNITHDASDPHVNFTYNVLQTIHSVDIHIEARITEKHNLEHFLTLNTTINLCGILDYNLKSPLGALIASFLAEHGHIFEKCPIVKSLYYVHKFWIPEDPHWSILPEVDFVVDVSGYHLDDSQHKTLILNDHFGGEMVVQDVNNVKRGILALLPPVQAG